MQEGVSKDMQSTAIKGFRLSLQQSRLWSLQGQRAYNAQCIIKVQGHLVSDIFQQALQILVERHSILRTLYQRIPGMEVPIQAVVEQGHVDLSIINLEALNDLAQSTQLDLHLIHTHQEPFDFENGPLLRVSLLHTAAETALLVISLPALCADSATLKNLVIELGRIYEACLQGRVLVDSPLLYADVSGWQDDLLREEDSEEHRESWRSSDYSQLLTQRLPFQRVGEGKWPF